MKRPINMFMILGILASVMIFSPRTATVAEAATTANPTYWECTIPGTGGVYYCYGSWDVNPGQRLQICLDSSSYGYPGGFYLNENGTGATVASHELYPQQCFTYTNNSGGFKSVYLAADSRSYFYQQYFTGSAAFV